MFYTRASGLDIESNLIPRSDSQMYCVVSILLHCGIKLPALIASFSAMATGSQLILSDLMATFSYNQL